MIRKIVDRFKQTKYKKSNLIGLDESRSMKFKSIDEVLPLHYQLDIRVTGFYYKDGNMPLTDLDVLIKLVRDKMPCNVFEIGTFEGVTTLQIASNCDGNIYTLDMPSDGVDDLDLKKIVWDPSLDVYPEVPGIAFKNSVHKSRIHQLFGDSRTFDYSPYVGLMDFVFVDACHHYEFVLSDSNNALKIASPGALVLWHDYAHYAPGVMRALDELAKSIDLCNIVGTTIVLHKVPE